MYEISIALRYAPEYWKDIEGFPNYQVSNHGRVKSKKTSKILKLYQTRGYLRVSLYNDAGRKCKLVHRLVAEAFIPNTQNKTDVNHINACKTDANVCNLEWATASENINHAYSSGLRPKIDTRGEKNGFSKLTNFQVIQIKQLLTDGQLTQKTIGSQFNVSRETISSIKSGRRWQNVMTLANKAVA
ncbi:MAG: NUMOD4 domain-containing protein [Pleurocapsa sp. MO_192.B19]|nr:NUMOD4 domain-containing protein [Pleurocapsa sp. MO_192.B19]